MQAANTTFGELIDGTKQFIIPVFQRDYAWTTDNWQQLWDDIVRSGGIDSGGHFVGSIVQVPDTTVAARPTYLVIDGQQRLTTLTILSAALCHHIRENPVQSDDDLPSVEEMEERFLLNRHRTGSQRYKMALRRADDETLQAVVDGKSLDTLQGTRSARIADAYAYFRRRLGEADTDLAEIYRGTTQLRVVEISLNRTVDNPQVVFESMNATGVDLTPGDLVRNYLLIGLPESEQTRLYNEYWSAVESLFRQNDGAMDDGALNLFLRDYIALKHRMEREPRANEIYRQIKAYAVRELNRGTTMETLLSDIRRFAKYYAAWNRRTGVASSAPTLADAFRRLRWHGTQSGMLAMLLYDCYDHRSSLSEKEFIQSLNLVEGYLVRHAVCGHQIRSYWRIFADMARDIASDTPAKSLRDTLIKERGQYGFWTFPKDETFSIALHNNEIYHNPRICKYLLDWLENADQKEPSPVNTYSIEHIMPQGLTDEWRCMLGENADSVHGQWLHRLGNLTLTAYNPEYSNRSFEEKKTIKGGFNESAVRLNQYVRKPSKWTAEQMEERGKMLAKRALEIWPFPQTS